MPKRHPNHRRVKIHSNFTVNDIASLFGIHKNTARGWVKEGLPTIDDSRPTLITGHDLVAFLKTRRAQRKQRCRPGEIYCVRFSNNDTRRAAGTFVAEQPLVYLPIPLLSARLDEARKERPR
jgi:hypothetical protein